MHESFLGDEDDQGEFNANYLHTILVLMSVLFIMDFDFKLGTSQKHWPRCILADEHYHLNAQRMKAGYNSKKVHLFEKGDIVLLRIPRIDRSATDLHRLPCVIVERLGTKQFLYRLQCEHGVLKTCYPGGELEAHSRDITIITNWNSASMVSLHEAAKKTNPLNTCYGSFCNCKGDCTGKKCFCKLAQKPCSTRCHSG